MDFRTELAGSIPYLRLFARALTGAPHAGEAAPSTISLRAEPQPITSKWASVVMPLLIGSMSWGQAEKTAIASISALNTT